MNKLLCAIIIGFAAPSFALEAGPIVAVVSGRLQGVSLDDGGVVFRGIPYAQPPVGTLRWREPVPALPWSGVRDASKFAPLCAQNPHFIPNAATISSEDCLYLNVWVPKGPTTTPKAVMVWMPGGGNFAGGSMGGVSDGQKLSQHGVVVVTINYRLGLFGFFAHSQLSRESGHHASGNQGILDQIAALRWVRTNIAAFGGDPSNVTIFGNSAASLDVSVLMTSPLSKGLYQHVIGQSGTVDLLGAPRTLAQAERDGQSFADRWTPGKQTLAAMRALPASAILASEPDFVHAPPPNLLVAIDGYVLPKRPAEVFAAGEEQSVDLLLGNTSREIVPGVDPPTNLQKSIHDDYGALAPRALALYQGNPSDPLYGNAPNQWVTDTTFRCPAVLQLMWHASAGHAAFEYQFDRAPPGRESDGAVHSQEMEYVFGTFGARGSLPASLFTEIDHGLSDSIERYWTNFAKTGNPNDATLPLWPKFEPRSRAYIEFTDLGPIAREGLRRPFCDLYIEKAALHPLRAKGVRPDNN
jgi:para-nitrobenzyl esterase